MREQLHSATHSFQELVDSTDVVAVADPSEVRNWLMQEFPKGVRKHSDKDVNADGDLTARLVGAKAARLATHIFNAEDA